MSAPARPIELVGTSVLQSLREAVAPELKAWAQDWLPGSCGELELAATALEASQLDTVSQVGPWECTATERGSVWFNAAKLKQRRLAHVMLGGDAFAGAGPELDSWTQRLVAQALVAQRRALGAVLLTPVVATSQWLEEALPRRLLRFGEGAIRLSCDRVGLEAVVDAPAWRELLGRAFSVPPRGGLTPLEAAACTGTVELGVVVGQVDVELAKVLDLRSGDVLRLPRRLDERLMVECDGRPLAEASLGERGGKLCMQLHPQPQC